MLRGSWQNALREACNRLAKYEYLIEHGKDPVEYIPNANESAEIVIKGTIIYTDIVARNDLEA